MDGTGLDGVDSIYQGHQFFQKATYEGVPLKTSAYKGSFADEFDSHRFLGVGQIAGSGMHSACATELGASVLPEIGDACSVGPKRGCSF